ncbi:MAG: sulfatase [Planctomycetota bacterium]
MHRARTGLLSLAALGACVGCTGGTDTDRRPDVVLVVIDTLRSDRLGAYGYGRGTSPFLDELADSGTLFEDVTSQSAWTLPSMVSLHHGRYVTGNHQVLHPNRATLAEIFQEAGYATVALINNLGMTQPAGFHRGFRWFDNRPARDAKGRPLRRTRDVGQALDDLRGHLTQLLAGEEEPRPPCLIYLHLMDPHHPYDPYPDAALTPGEDPVEGRGMPWDWQVDALASAGPAAPVDDPGWEASWEDIRRSRDLYDQGVRQTDDGLRAIFAELEELGLLDHAVVAVASDHGEALWERVSLFAEPERYRESAPADFFYRGHGALLNREAIATPLFFSGVGVPAGVRVDEPVENVDLLPTLLQLCDLPLVEGLHGRSLVARMRGAEDGREAVFSYGHNAATVRELSTGLKLIRPNPGRAGAPQLFDAVADPNERRDLAAERPDDVARLAGLLAAWEEEHPNERPRQALLEGQLERLRQMGYTADDIGR